MIVATILGGLLMAGSAQEIRSIALDVEQVGETIEVTLTGHSPVSQRVEYELELSGNSNSTHKGSTVLKADARAVLSTMRMQGGDDWCVRARVREEDGRTYEYAEGSCA